METADLVQLGLLWPQMERFGRAEASAVAPQILSEDVAAVRIQDSGVIEYEEDTSPPKLPET